MASRPQDDRPSRLDDSGLLVSYLLYGVAHNVHVVEANGSDGRADGILNDVGCVLPPADAALQHRVLTALSLEFQERHHGQYLEEPLIQFLLFDG